MHLCTRTDQGGVVNIMSAQHTIPAFTPQPTVSLTPEDPLSKAPQYPINGCALSDWDMAAAIEVGQPPRIVETSIMKQLKQVVQNDRLPVGVHEPLSIQKMGVRRMYKNLADL